MDFFPAMELSPTTTLPEPSEHEKLFQMRELRNQVERLNTIRRENGIAFYNPHDKQDRFHSAGDHKRRYVRTGNRWGKSTSGTCEDISWCAGERLFYPEGDPRRYRGIPKRSVKGVLIVQDWDKAEEIFTSQEEGQGKGKIFQYLPKELLVGVERTQSGHIYKILIRSKWGGISTLYIDTVKSFKQNPQGHESSDWDFVHVDEPIPEAMWAAYSRGLIDRGGSAWFMCTPLTELWINDYFIPPGKGRMDFNEGTAFTEEKQANFWVMTGSSRDNPTLTEESIADFARDVPKGELEARLEGRPRQLSGIIHKQFDRDIHIYSEPPPGWRSMWEPPPDWTLRAAIDPHYKIPMAVLFCATGPQGHTYFFNEIFHNFLLDDLAKEIHERVTFDTTTRDFFTVYCDPIAWTPNPHSGVTWADTFHMHGLQVVPGSKQLMEGILKTEELLKKRDKHGKPMIMFSSLLSRTLYEFDRYVWDQKMEKPADNGPDHMMENLHRLVMDDLPYIDPFFTPRTVQPLFIRSQSLKLPSYDLPKPVRSSLNFNSRYKC